MGISGKRTAREVCTYKQPRHGPVLPRQLLNAQLPRQRPHDIQQRNEPGRLHRRPRQLARNVEARLDGSLALWVVGDEPLDCRELEEIG